MKNIIHIGFAKNASTYLQQNLFVRSQKYQYIGKPLNDFAEPQDAFLKSLIYGNPESRDRTLESILQEIKAGSGGKPLLLSEEEIATSALHSTCTPDQIREKLHRLLPDSRILLINRDFVDTVESLYAYMLRYSLIAPESFQSFCQRSLDAVMARFAVAGLLASYAADFGAESISVIDLKKKQDLNALMKDYLQEDIDDARDSQNERLQKDEYIQLMTTANIPLESYKDQLYEDQTSKLRFHWNPSDRARAEEQDVLNYEAIKNYRVL